MLVQREQRLRPLPRFCHRPDSTPILHQNQLKKGGGYEKDGQGACGSEGHVLECPHGSASMDFLTHAQLLDGWVLSTA